MCILYNVTMVRSQKYITEKYGHDFWIKFKASSNYKLKMILPKVPDIGVSIFSFNYQFGPYYIAWYKTYMELGLSSEEACQNLWVMNEKMVTTVPKALLHAIGKSYLNGFRKKAAAHVERQKKNVLHPYDWKVEYREISQNSFELDITECGLLKLVNDFDARGMLPSICRMDYLFSNLMGNGFARTKTLGDGDDCCNCHYDLVGKCDWSPEKGFTDRK